MTPDHIAALEAANAALVLENAELRKALSEYAERTLSILALVNMQTRDNSLKLRELAECRIEARRVLPFIREALSRPALSPSAVAEVVKAADSLYSARIALMLHGQQNASRDRSVIDSVVEWSVLYDRYDAALNALFAAVAALTPAQEKPAP